MINKSCKYEIIFLGEARKDLKKINKSDNLYILKKIKELAELKANLNIKKLKFKNDLYRLRSGNYRIVYAVKKNELIILVIAVAHRKEIYNKVLKRIR